MATDADTKESDRREQKKTAEIVLGGTVGESLAACVAIVLCIIGLARIDEGSWGFSSSTASSFAAIAIGAALFFEGVTISIRFSDLIRETSKGKLDIAELDAGITVESVGGLFGIALGIVALVDWLPQFMIPAAAILFGATLIVGSLVKIRLNTMEAEKAEQHPLAVKAARDAVIGSAGMEVLFGLVAIILGVIALQKAVEALELELGPPSEILSLVSLLALSLVILVRGSSLAYKMFTIFRF